jgi:hypothetical protein
VPLIVTRLNNPVKLIIKTTDLSAAGYALSVGSGGVAVSDTFAPLTDMLTNAGRYFDPLPILASLTTRPQLFEKGLFPLTFDARHQHPPHFGFWYRRHLSRKARCGLSGGILGNRQDPRRCSAGSDYQERCTSDLVSPHFYVQVDTDDQLVQRLRQIHGRFRLASDDPKLFCESGPPAM